MMDVRCEMVRGWPDVLFGVVFMLYCVCDCCLCGRWFGGSIGGMRGRGEEVVEKWRRRQR